MANIADELGCGDIDLRKCPNCSSGVPADGVQCEFCGAVVALREDGSDLDLISIVCGRCGCENGPHLDRCTGCDRPLQQVCPRCQNETLQGTDARCLRCRLNREEFYAECVRLEIARCEARVATEKRIRRGNLFFLVVAILLAVVGWFHHFIGYVAEGKGLIVLGVAFLLLWLFSLKRFEKTENPMMGDAAK